MLKTMPRFLALLLFYAAIPNNLIAVTIKDVSDSLEVLSTNLGLLQNSTVRMKEKLTELKNIVDHIVSSQSTAPTFNIEPYKRILLVGVPADAVLNKMKFAGASQADIETVIPNTTTQSEKTSPITATGPLGTISNASLTLDSKFDQYIKLKKIGMSNEAIVQKMHEAKMPENDITTFFSKIDPNFEVIPTSSQPKPINIRKNSPGSSATPPPITILEELANKQTLKSTQEKKLFAQEPLANETIKEYLVRYAQQSRDVTNLIKDILFAQLCTLENDYTWIENEGPENNDEKHTEAIKLLLLAAKSNRTTTDNQLLFDQERKVLNNFSDMNIFLAEKINTKITDAMKTETLTSFNAKVTALKQVLQDKKAEAEDAARAALSQAPDYVALDEIDRPTNTNDVELVAKLKRWYEKQIAHMTATRTADINTKIVTTQQDLATKTTTLQELEATLTKYFSDLNISLSASSRKQQSLEDKITIFQAEATNAFKKCEKHGTASIETPTLMFVKNILNIAPADLCFRASHADFCQSLIQQTPEKNKKNNLSIQRQKFSEFYTALIQPTLDQIERKKTLVGEMQALSDTIKALETEKNAILKTINPDATKNLAWLLADLFKKEATTAFRTTTMQAVLKNDVIEKKQATKPGTGGLIASMFSKITQKPPDKSDSDPDNDSDNEWD